MVLMLNYINLSNGVQPRLNSAAHYLPFYSVTFPPP